MSAGLPKIPGYEVWRGRVLLHARSRGTVAQTRAAGRPWHVVADSPDLLIALATTQERPRTS